MSKAVACKAIYDEVVEKYTVDGQIDFKKVRSECVQRFVDEAGCTPAGANTYYANCKNRNGATGSYISKGNGHAGHTSSNPNYRESNDPDDRQLYSSVQINKAGLVAAVDAYYNPTDAIARSKRVRGITVLGAPELGESVDSLQRFDESVLNSSEMTEQQSLLS